MTPNTPTQYYVEWSRFGVSRFEDRAVECAHREHEPKNDNLLRLVVRPNTLQPISGASHNAIDASIFGEAVAGDIERLKLFDQSFVDDRPSHSNYPQTIAYPWNQSSDRANRFGNRKIVSPVLLRVHSCTLAIVVVGKLGNAQPTRAKPDVDQVCNAAWSAPFAAYDAFNTRAEECARPRTSRRSSVRQPRVSEHLQLGSSAWGGAHV